MSARRRSRRSREEGSQRLGWFSRGSGPQGDHHGTSFEGRRRIAVHVVALVLLVVLGRSVHLAFAAEGQQPDPRINAEAPRTPFELFDRHGQALALSVECFDLSVSPRSLWRAHTPQRLALALAEPLGADPRELLLRLLPQGTDSATGEFVPVAPRLLRFDRDQVPRVQAWLRSGTLEADAAEERPLAGWRWVVLEDGRHATLAWQPAVVLSAEERVRHLGKGALHRPDRWTRKLLGDLGELVTEFGLPKDIREDLQRLPRPERRVHLADVLWAELCPTTFRVVERSVDPLVAHEIDQRLREEQVSPWQIQLQPTLRRFQPVRHEAGPALALGESALASADGFGILGHWGVLDREDAMRQALRERDQAPHLLPWSEPGDPVLARAEELANQWKPWSGLERLCSDALQTSGLDREWDQRSRAYTVRARSLARDRRSVWPDKRVPDYLESSADGDPKVELHSTLDAELQHQLHAELLAVMERFDPAVAMGICVEVDSGKVLAVDGMQAYPGSRYLPTQHVFTPGSTFKAVIMAAALDRQVVWPGETFDTFAPKGYVVRHNKSWRLIREAEGAPHGSITATTGLARSVNAVLVQIGMRLDSADLRGILSDLGYGQRPEIGIGLERGGYLPELRQGTWSRTQTHASVCFGHEIGVTLWQHAQGLATLARRGHFRPLRLLDAVSQGSDWRTFPAGADRQVLSEAACDNVLAMMAEGALTGTGRHVAGPKQCPEFHYIGTKTGTTEKVHSEVCIHIELQHAQMHKEQGTTCSKACYAALRGQRDHKRKRVTCYTSSMCAVGQLEPGGPMILSLIVVDDPRSKEKFGGDVAGASAIRMLRQAHGLPAEVTHAEPEGLPAMPAAAFNGAEYPWLQAGAEAERAWGHEASADLVGYEGWDADAVESGSNLAWDGEFGSPETLGEATFAGEAEDWGTLEQPEHSWGGQGREYDDEHP